MTAMKLLGELAFTLGHTHMSHHHAQSHHHTHVTLVDTEHDTKLLGELAFTLGHACRERGELYTYRERRVVYVGMTLVGYDTRSHMYMTLGHACIGSGELYT